MAKKGKKNGQADTVVSDPVLVQPSQAAPTASSPATEANGTETAKETKPKFVQRKPEEAGKMLNPRVVLIDASLQTRGHSVSDRDLVILATDIRQNGQINPISVTKAGQVEEETTVPIPNPEEPSKPKYETKKTGKFVQQYKVIAGFTREAAGRLILTGFTGLDGTVYEPLPSWKIRADVFDVDEKAAVKMGYKENRARTEINVMDQAYFHERLRKEHEMTDADIARFDEVSQAHVNQTRLLLRAPSGMQKAIQDGNISGYAARQLLKLFEKSPEAVNEFLAGCERDGYGEEHLKAFTSELRNALFGEVEKRQANEALGIESQPKGHKPPNQKAGGGSSVSTNTATVTAANRSDYMMTLLETIIDESPCEQLVDIAKSLKEVLDQGKGALANAWIGCHVAFNMERAQPGATLKPGQFQSWSDLAEKEMAEAKESETVVVS